MKEKEECQDRLKGEGGMEEEEEEEGKREGEGEGEREREREREVQTTPIRHVISSPH